MIEQPRNLQDIIRDREIIKIHNQEFQGIHYEQWNVSLPIFSDQIEDLLKNGFIVSVLEKDKVNICRKLNSSPDQIEQNKQFCRSLESALND